MTGAGTPSRSARLAQATIADISAGTFYYRLVQVDTDGTTATHGPVTVMVGTPTPEQVTLGAAQPNPFDESVTIPYAIPSAMEVRLAVYDAQGRIVRVLVDRVQEPAQHKALWDGKDAFGNPVAAGQYFYRLVTERFVDTKPLVLIR